MSQGKYSGGSPMTLITIKQQKYRVFGKKSGNRYVCNTCLKRFQQGDRAKMTRPGAYRHINCEKGN